MSHPFQTATLASRADIMSEQVERLHTAFSNLGIGDGPIYGHYIIMPQELLLIHTSMCVGLAGGNISLGTENRIKAICILCLLAGLNVNRC